MNADPVRIDVEDAIAWAAALIEKEAREARKDTSDATD